MKKLFKILLIMVCIGNGFADAQEMHFTQLYAAPVFLNPAFTGANACARFSMVSRVQWAGMIDPYKTMLVSFDHSPYNYPIGLGLIVGVDEAGAGTLRTTVVKPSFAYEARIQKLYTLRLAVQPGLGIKSVNFNSLLFGDQIYRGGSGVKTVETPMSTKTYFDFGAGAVFNGSNFWTGLAFNHLNMPDESFLATVVQRMPIECKVQAGAKLDLNKDEKDAIEKKYFSPVVHYSRQNKFDQVDIGFYYSKHIFTLGLWYRGIPGLKAYKRGYQNNDAIAVIVGMQTTRFKIGYSYDQTISNLSTVSKGAHEVTLSYQICNPKKRRSRLVLISCPKF